MIYRRMLHRTERAWHARYCLTLWVDRPSACPVYPLILPPACTHPANIARTAALLAASPMQRALSRAVYRELYERSLLECLAGSPAVGRAEMLAAHARHLEAVDANSTLREIVDALREYALAEGTLME